MPSAMRTADRRVPLGRARALAAAVAIGMVACACGGGPPSAPPVDPTPVVTPGPTPVAHLSDPVKVDDVYRALLAAGLRIAPNNASTGGPVTSRSSGSTRRTSAGRWRSASSARRRAFAQPRTGRPAARPGQGEAPIAFIGENILVEWGATGGGSPKHPDDRQLAAAEALHAALDPLVSPVVGRTIVTIPGVAAPTVSLGTLGETTPRNPTKKP